MRQAHLAAKAEELRMREEMTAKKALWKHQSKSSNLFNSNGGFLQHEANWTVDNQGNESNVANFSSTILPTRVPDRGTMRAEV